MYVHYMILKTLALTLFSTAFAFNQQALDLNKTCGDFENFYHAYQIDSFKQYISCAKIDEYDNMINSIGNFSPYKPKISVLIHKSSGNASFDYGGNISVPASLVFSGKYGTRIFGDISGIPAIFAHEYGHAIFAEALKDKDFYTSFHKLSKSISQLRTLLVGEYVEGSSYRRVDYIKSRSKELKEKRKKVLSNSKIRFISAYNELFSDVVATYQSNNKSAITNALYHHDVSDKEYMNLLARSLVERDHSNLSYRSVHTYFAETRTYIGTNFWPSSQEQKEEYLSIILRAIMLEIDEKFEKSNEHTAKTLNKGLIERLEGLKPL
ncbi:MAG: hypothetical protein CME69_12670 [Halobacteriovorax sp.]|nr:hypothetical protein [Halobacteriovorax sp.]